MPRITDKIDALLGTTSFRGDVVRTRNGVHTNGESALLDTIDALAPAGGDTECSPRRHGRLRGDARCGGCGRTRNDFVIDGRR